MLVQLESMMRELRVTDPEAFGKCAALIRELHRSHRRFALGTVIVEDGTK